MSWGVCHPKAVKSSFPTPFRPLKIAVFPPHWIKFFGEMLSPYQNFQKKTPAICFIMHQYQIFRIRECRDFAQLGSVHVAGTSKSTKWECRWRSRDEWCVCENFELHTTLQQVQEQRNYCTSPWVSYIRDGYRVELMGDGHIMLFW